MKKKLEKAEKRVCLDKVIAMVTSTEGCDERTSSSICKSAVNFFLQIRKSPGLDAARIQARWIQAAAG